MTGFSSSALRALQRRRAKVIHSRHYGASLLVMIALMFGLLPLVGCAKKPEGSTLTALSSTTASQPMSRYHKIKHYEDILKKAYESLPDIKAHQNHGVVYSIAKSTEGVLWYMAIKESTTSVSPYDTSKRRAPYDATIFFQKPGLGDTPSIHVHWNDREQEDLNFFPDLEKIWREGGAKAKEIADLLQKIAEVSEIPAVFQVADAVRVLSMITSLPEFPLIRKDGKIVALRGDLKDLAGANLKDADLKGVSLMFGNFESSDFRGANLEGVRSEYAKLSYADFRGANLKRAHLSEADFRGANFENANLSGISSVTRSNFAGAKFTGTNFSGARVESGDFPGADFRGANFENASLRDSNFAGADFRGANFAGAKFVPSIIAGINFAGADLRGANFMGADLQGANFMGANLDGANFGNAKVGKANFKNATITDKTRMPLGWKCFVIR